MAESFASTSGFNAIAPAFPSFNVNTAFHSVELDPSSPDVSFKQNLHLISEQVMLLQNVARSALDGIQNAYHLGSSPVQTESDIATLKQNLEMLAELMRQTGIGALPLVPLEQTPPTEAQIMLDVSQSVKVLYARLQRNQESAGVVANLLDTSVAARRGK